MSNVWVTGANGQVGGAIKRLVADGTYEGFEFHFTDRREVDMTDRDAVVDFIRRRRIDAVMNCAAYTAVDAAEEDSQNAYAVNRDAVAYLAQTAKEKGIWLIHVSTDYVFSGCYERPIDEDAPTRPQGVYARSKFEGEEAIRTIAPEYAVVLRTSWVYDETGKNFLKTMLRLGSERDSLRVVCDQIGTPTYAEDIARTLLTILAFGKEQTPRFPAVYHFSNEGCASWYDFAHRIFTIAKIDCDVEAIASEEYPTPAKRPFYSVLDKRKIKTTYDLHIDHWEDALKRCMARLGYGSSDA